MGENQILALARRADVLEAFPRFAQYQLKAVSPGCKCNRAAKIARSRSYSLTGLRNALRSLSPADQAKLKSLLGVREITFFHRGPSGPERVTI